MMLLPAATDALQPLDVPALDRVDAVRRAEVPPHVEAQDVRPPIRIERRDEFVRFVENYWQHGKRVRRGGEFAQSSQPANRRRAVPAYSTPAGSLPGQSATTSAEPRRHAAAGRAKSITAYSFTAE